MNYSEPGDEALNTEGCILEKTENVHEATALGKGRNKSWPSTMFETNEHTNTPLNIQVCWNTKYHEWAKAQSGRNLSIHTEKEERKRTRNAFPIKDILQSKSMTWLLINSFYDRPTFNRLWLEHNHCPPQTLLTAERLDKQENQQGWPALCPSRLLRCINVNKT